MGYGRPRIPGMSDRTRLTSRAAWVCSSAPAPGAPAAARAAAPCTATAAAGATADSAPVEPSVPGHAIVGNVQLHALAQAMEDAVAG